MKKMKETIREHGRCWIFLAALLAVECALCWLGLRGFLGDVVMPRDYDYIDSYEWADTCAVWLSWAIGLFASLHISGLHLHKAKKPHKAWLYWMIFLTVLTFIMPTLYFFINPLDDGILPYLLVWLFNLLVGPLNFFLITLAAPYYWDFNPIRR